MTNGRVTVKQSTIFETDTSSVPFYHEQFSHTQHPESMVLIELYKSVQGESSFAVAAVHLCTVR